MRATTVVFLASTNFNTEYQNIFWKLSENYSYFCTCIWQVLFLGYFKSIRNQSLKLARHEHLRNIWRCCKWLLVIQHYWYDVGLTWFNIMLLNKLKGSVWCGKHTTKAAGWSHWAKSQLKHLSVLLKSDESVFLAYILYWSKFGFQNCTTTKAIPKFAFKKKK